MCNDCKFGDSCGAFAIFMFEITIWHPLSPARIRDGLENRATLLKATMSATTREDNNRIQEKDDQEMEATVFISQETPSGLFTLGELETEENSGKVVSWEFPTALSLLMKDWVGSIDDRTRVVDRLRHKYEDHDEDMCCNCRHYCD